MKHRDVNVIQALQCHPTLYPTGMTHTQLGLLLGGLIPAFLFGIAGLFQKFSAQQPITLGAHLVAIGIGVVSVGIAICLYNMDQTYSIKAAIPSFVIGAGWGSGMFLVAIAITKYSANLAQIAPLYNMNTLVTVIAALVIFSEWKDVNMTKLIIGTVMIIAGGVLVST